MNIHELPIEKKKLSELKPASYNPRKISKRRFLELRRSYERFGYAGIVVWNKRTEHIVGGHQGVEVMKAIIGEDKEIDVRVVDLPEAEEKALNIRLNKHDGEFDEDKLIGVLDEIEKDKEEMLKLTGFEDKEVELLLNKLPKVFEKGEEDRYGIGNIKATKVKEGDVFELDNKHRIVCGHPSIKENWDLLMEHRYADLFFMTPPYDQKIDMLPYKDNQEFSEHMKLMEKVYNNAKQYLKENRFLVINLPDYSKININAYHGIMLDKCAFKYQRTIYWLKPEVPTHARVPYPRWYQPKVRTEQIQIFNTAVDLDNDPERAEITLVYSDQKVENKNKPHISETTPIAKGELKDYMSNVWRIGQEDRGRTPPILINKLLRFYSLENESVVDPFSTDAHTLMEAQKLGRTAFLMDSDPRCVEVAIRKYKSQYPNTSVECKNRDVEWK